MHVTIFGTGYVGLVTGACLADVGHNVICMDINQLLIDRLNRGEIPIYEPGLQTIVERNVREGTLTFTTDASRAVSHADMQIIAVGTPPDESGAADLTYVLTVAETIAAYMRSFKVVVVKSTVPVGTCDKVATLLQSSITAHRDSPGFEVVSNPEFLKEGAAVSDFQKPDRIIVGTDSAKARSMMAELYEPFSRNHARMIFMDRRSSELTKYAANAMLATKISFINEIANLAEKLGADIEQVRQGIGADPRIGHHFIYPGIGYGGSCFPKDVQALTYIAAEIGYDASLLRAVEEVNTRQKHRLFEKIATYYGGPSNLEGKTIALWGLSFKPNTDDMREASSRVIMEALWRAGASVQAFDPVASEEAMRIYGVREDLTLTSDKYMALDGADALVICTEWQQFRAPDFVEIALRLKTKTIFDGRNLFVPERLRADGWVYMSIGRAVCLPDPPNTEKSL